MISNTRRLSYLVLALSMLLIVGLHFAFMRANGKTVDEFIHLDAGYRYWQCGEFASNPEHPPLAKWVAGFPIRNWRIGEFPTECGTSVPESDGLTAYAVSESVHANQMLWKARTAMLIFPVLLLICVFFATRKWFGEIAASIAVILLACEPTVIAHSSLITTDGAVATFTFASIWMGIELATSRSKLYAIGLALALGFAIASKHSAVVLPFILLVIIATALACAAPERRRSFLSLGLCWVSACVVAALMLWANYGFRYSALPAAGLADMNLGTSLHRAGLDSTVTASLVKLCAEEHLLPESYLAGVVHIATNFSRPSYLLGRLYATGVPMYFPVAVVVKTTAGVLLLLILAIAVARTNREYRRVFIPLFVAAVLLLCVGMSSKLNIGIRHLLSLYPIMIVLAAGGAAVAFRRGTATKVFVSLCLLASVVSGLRATPHQLSYASEIFGGPDRLHYYLADSNLDWGQSDAEMDTILARVAKEGPCAIVAGNFSRVMRSAASDSNCILLPSDFGVDTVRKQLPPTLPDHWTGTVILQPLALASTSAYLPLIRQKPSAVYAQGTILVYRGEFDFGEVAALRRFHRGLLLMEQARALWPSAQSRALAESASIEFAAAREHCPLTNRVTLEVAYTASLTAQERWEEARYHAREVLLMTDGIPTYSSERQFILDALAAN